MSAATANAMPRADFVALVEDVLSHHNLTPADEARVLHAARTIPRLPLGVWMRGSCGCVIGTAFADELADLTDPGNRQVEAVLGTKLMDVGCDIDAAAHDVLDFDEDINPDGFLVIA